jgi:hypothetical protein
VLPVAVPGCAIEWDPPSGIRASAIRLENRYRRSVARSPQAGDHHPEADGSAGGAAGGARGVAFRASRCLSTKQSSVFSLANIFSKKPQDHVRLEQVHEPPERENTMSGFLFGAPGEWGHSRMPSRYAQLGPPAKLPSPAPDDDAPAGCATSADPDAESAADVAVDMSLARHHARSYERGIPARISPGSTPAPSQRTPASQRAPSQRSPSQRVAIRPPTRPSLVRDPSDCVVQFPAGTAAAHAAGQPPRTLVHNPHDPTRSKALVVLTWLRSCIGRIVAHGGSGVDPMRLSRAMDDLLASYQVTRRDLTWRGVAWLGVA